ncbi:MAG: glycosyltransferase family 39 protein, partial [Planctomycetota bacterium]
TMSVLTCLVGLHEGPPMGDHECINALAARNALQSGDWLIPMVNDAPLIRKMPLGVWLIAAAAYVPGAAAGSAPVTLFSARLPSALAGIGTVLVTAWLGSMLFGRRGGLIAGFLCAGCAATVFYSRNAQVDMVLTFFTTLAFACFWRGAMHEQPSRWSMAWFYVAFALAMMAKAPLPLATVGLSLFAYWFVTIPFLAASIGGQHPSGGFLRRFFGEWAGQLSRLRTLWLLPGIAVFVILVGVWPAYVSTQVDNALELWRIEYLSRFTGELSDKTQPVWYYLPLLFGLTLPFMLSIPEAVVAPFLPRYAAQRRGLAYAFTWALAATWFLSSSGFKRPHYLLSVIPAYCLLLAPVIDRLFFGVVSTAGRGARFACRVLPALLAAGGIAGGVMVRQKYPGLLTPYAIAF